MHVFLLDLGVVFLYYSILRLLLSCLCQGGRKINCRDHFKKSEVATGNKSERVELLVFRITTRSEVIYAGEHTRSEIQDLRFAGSVNCMKHINTILGDKSIVEKVTDMQVCSGVQQLTLEAQVRNKTAVWKMS